VDEGGMIIAHINVNINIYAGNCYYDVLWFD
jgi:hypothetical protein